jgi:hypothetical protein
MLTLSIGTDILTLHNVPTVHMLSEKKIGFSKHSCLEEYAFNRLKFKLRKLRKLSKQTNLPPVSITRAKLVTNFAAGVVDTGGAPFFGVKILYDH